MPFNLPDRDVFIIDANANPPALVSGTSNVVGVGTVLFNMAVRPNASNQLYVDATPMRGTRSASSRASSGDPLGRGVQGHIAESRITVINGTTPTPRHLNPHIDYSVHAARLRAVGGGARGQPGVPDGHGVLEQRPARSTSPVSARARSASSTPRRWRRARSTRSTKTLVEVGGGPSGLALDEARNRLYVMNRFTHDISIVSNASTPATAIETAVVPLRFNPEPAIVRDGRPFLYDARNTSGHGDSACASCHIFGDFDSLAWDLGDPFGAVEPNDNPFRVDARRWASASAAAAWASRVPTCVFHPHEGAHDDADAARHGGRGPDALAR